MKYPINLNEIVYLYPCGDGYFWACVNDIYEGKYESMLLSEFIIQYPIQSKIHTYLRKK